MVAMPSIAVEHPDKVAGADSAGTGLGACDRLEAAAIAAMWFT
jgi:hypothetical protein